MRDLNLKSQVSATFLAKKALHYRWSDTPSTGTPYSRRAVPLYRSELYYTSTAVVGIPSRGMMGV
jgi:hypothetical protein